jgi:pyrimidine operon attenuation protein/uracil phosphoribosyltransferase
MSKYFDGKDLTFMSPEVKENGRHQVMTNVQPDIKTKYVNIDTRFQEDYNMQTADVTFKLPQQITNVKSIKVTNIEIPASFYPFSLRRKNTYFKITDNAALMHATIIRIDDRFYTKDTIVTAILAQLSGMDLSFGFQMKRKKRET